MVHELADHPLLVVPALSAAWLLAASAAALLLGRTVRIAEQRTGRVRRTA